MKKNCPLCNHKNIDYYFIGSHRVVKCEKCSLNYIISKNANFKKEKYYSDYFSRNRSDFNETSYIKRLEQTKVDAMHLNNNLNEGNILDIGCSTGEMIHQLNSIGDYQFIGTDLDISAIKYATEKYNSSKNISFLSQNVLDISFSYKFDIIIFRGTLQYLAWDLVPTFNFLKTILNKNGKIFIYSIPNSESFVYYLLKQKWQMFHPDEHQIIFNKNALIYLKNKFKLKLEEMSFPYLETPYADVEKDYSSILDIINKKSSKGVPFWGSTIQCIFVNN